MNPAKHLVENRSVQLIFRDCLKLASRMVENPQQVVAVRTLLRKEFEKNKDVYDQDKIHALKMKYLLFKIVLSKEFQTTSSTQFNETINSSIGRNRIFLKRKINWSIDSDLISNIT